MRAQFVFLGCFLLSVNGARIRRDAEDDCANPPQNTERVNCCAMPRHHLWGRIKPTIRYCADKFRVGEDEEAPATTPVPLEGGHGHHRRYSFRRNVHDGCFLECMFEREGFLVDNTVNKEAILERVRESQDENEWKETAEAAVEKCATDDIEVAANETCRSGAAEIVKCVMQHMFLECPTWLENNDYCTSLKEFYLRCPNGPPPEVFFKRHHRHRRHGTSQKDRKQDPEDDQGEQEDVDDDEESNINS